MPSQPIATWMTPCDSCRVEVPGTGRRRHTIGLIPGSQTLSCRALPAYGLGKGACLSRMAASDRVSSGDLADAASSVPGTPRTLVVPNPVQQRVRYRRLFASGRVRGSPVPSGPPTHEIPDSPETPHPPVARAGVVILPVNRKLGVVAAEGPILQSLANPCLGQAFMLGSPQADAFALLLSCADKSQESSRSHAHRVTNNGTKRSVLVNG